MSFINDLVKLNLVRSGYLADMPYHLISDKEMCNAFISAKQHGDKWVVDDNCYFAVNYPCMSEELSDVYNKLVDVILYHISKFQEVDDLTYTLPDWLYSYMLGEVISINSPKADIHDMLVAMGVDNLEDEFTAEASAMCAKMSEAWMNKFILSDKQITDVDHPHFGQLLRTATIFGEPHVLKFLRLQSI